MEVSLSSVHECQDFPHTFESKFCHVLNTKFDQIVTKITLVRQNDVGEDPVASKI